MGVGSRSSHGLTALFVICAVEPNAALVQHMYYPSDRMDNATYTTPVPSSPPVRPSVRPSTEDVCFLFFICISPLWHCACSSRTTRAVNVRTDCFSYYTINVPYISDQSGRCCCHSWLVVAVAIGEQLQLLYH